MRGQVLLLHTSDVLRAHSYLGARGWELDDAPPADRPAELSGFRVVFGYHRRDGRRGLLAVDDAGGTLVLYEYPRKGGDA